MKKILPLPYRCVNATGPSVPQLKVEADGDHIAILNKIALALQAQFARLASRRHYLGIKLTSSPRKICASSSQIYSK